MISSAKLLTKMKRMMIEDWYFHTIVAMAITMLAIAQNLLRIVHKPHFQAIL